MSAMAGSGLLSKLRPGALGAMLASVTLALGAMAGSAQAEATSTSCAGVPGKWYVAPPREGWENQCEMVNDPNISGKGVDRETWVLDPGIGKFLTRDQLLKSAGNYERYGFKQRFLWYAAMRKVTPAGSSKWSACHYQYRTPVTFCANVNTTPKKTIGQDFFGSDTLDAIAWGSDWIALACGNFHLPVAGDAPTPVIKGFNFADENRDGRLDDGERGRGGATFTLSRVGSYVKQSNAANLGTVTSDSGGNFSFALDKGEGPGVYVVTEHYDSSWPNTTPLSRAIVVPEGAGDGEHLPTLTFGERKEIPPVSVPAPEQADQSSAQGADVTLDGSGSYSPTGDPITYTWTGPFGTAHGVRPTVPMPPGTHEVALTVSDGIKSTTKYAPVTVFRPITASPVAISATEGNAFEGSVATFTDPDPSGVASDYVATIDWGDGAPASTGAIVKGASGTFTVSGAHTYADEGAYHPSVTITDADVEYNTATVIDSGAIADAPLEASNVDFLSTDPVSHELATFTDGNPQATVSDFTATIDWGDGTATTEGQVSGPAGGPFAVTGSHTYATLGRKTVTIHIVDDGGSTATATDHIIVYQRSGFVIGDCSAGLGTQVTFWSSEWSQLNQLSDGPAPDAFKGYENDPGPSTTLTSWTTAPGDDSKPPATVPTFMSVIVSSSIEKNGKTISGNAPGIVIVQTNEGYGPSTSETGTGTVVATLREYPINPCPGGAFTTARHD